MDSLIKKNKSVLSSQRFCIIFMVIAYVLGIVLGFIFFNEQEKLLFADNSVNFIVIAIGRDGSPIKLFFSRFLNFLIIFAVFALLGLVVFLLPIQFIIIIYRGYILGASAVIFFTSFGITGLVVFLFAILIQNVVTTAMLIFFSAIALDAITSRSNCGKMDYKYYFISLAVCFVVSVVGALIELIMIMCILRPLNFYF